MENQQLTTFLVSGMTCSSCASHVEGALRRLAGVSDVGVDVRDGRVHVEHDGRSSVEAMLDALRAAGYEGAPA